MTATHDDQQKLLEEYRNSFEENKEAMAAILEPHAKNALCVIATKVAATMLMATEADVEGPDQPMIATLKALPSIVLNGTQFTTWAHSPRLTNCGIWKDGVFIYGTDTAVLTFYLMPQHGGKDYEFDATLTLGYKPSTWTVTLDNFRLAAG